MKVVLDYLRNLLEAFEDAPGPYVDVEEWLGKFAGTQSVNPGGFEPFHLSHGSVARQGLCATLGWRLGMSIRQAP